MKFTIKEIKERASKGDKVETSGIVKTVYGFKAKEMQYSIGTQNISIIDDTGSITVSRFVNTEAEIIPKEWEGKKVEVSGEYNVYLAGGKTYIGISKARVSLELPDTPIQSIPEPKFTQDPAVETRLKLLDIAVKYAIEKEINCGVEEVILIAKEFEPYIMGKTKVQEAVEKAEQLRAEKEIPF